MKRLRQKFVWARWLAAILCLVALTGCGLKTGYAPSKVTVHRGAAAAPAPAPGDSIRVVSWNIQYGENVAKAVGEIRANPELAAADIILLVHPHHKKLFGNAVLSRWPIINDQVLILPHETILTGHRRIAVAADIDLGSRTVRAISIHTATVVMNQDNRIDQAKAVRDSLGGFQGPVILGGDFNTISEYEVTLLRQTMRRLRLKPVRLPEGPTIANKYKKVPGSVPVLDHFFCKEFVPGSRGVDRSALASDHYPIWAVLAAPQPENDVEKENRQ